MNIVVVERANAGGIPAERFRSDVEPLADCARFKKYVSVATIAKNARGFSQIRNHRNGEA